MASIQSFLHLFFLFFFSRWIFLDIWFMAWKHWALSVVSCFIPAALCLISSSSTTYLSWHVQGPVPPISSSFHDFELMNHTLLRYHFFIHLLAVTILWHV